MTETHKTVLVVEDDESLRYGLEENLKIEGYEVLSTAIGSKGLDLARSKRPDLILLDIVLPEMTGYQVCKALRDEGNNVPVIMLTARGEEVDKITGFDMGADDYVTKPFSIRLLLARVKATLRRSEDSGGTGVRYAFGQFVLDMRARTLTKTEEDVPLTRTEFDLLACFLANEGQALSREKLLDDVWGMEYMGTQRSLDTFVAGLRSKLEANPKQPTMIHTIHGVGYKFTLPQ